MLTRLNRLKEKRIKVLKLNNIINKGRKMN